MYILATALCLLGFASAQTVTELTSCLTTENKLQMDCKYQLNTKSQEFTCVFKQKELVVASNNASDIQDQAFKDRGNVALIGNDICRLSLINFTGNKATDYTCNIKQNSTGSKTMSVSKESLVECSAWSLQGSWLLLMMTSFFYMLETKWL